MDINEYIGKVCPYCKSEFKEGDNIVVCSACDMPHHRECWVENQGCTTFGCQGTIQGLEPGANSVTATGFTYENPAPVQPAFNQQPAYNPAPQQPVYNQPAPAPQPAPAAQTVYCTSCGNVVPAGSAFCISCGNEVKPAQPAQPAYNPAPVQPAYNPQPAQPDYNQLNSYNQNFNTPVQPTGYNQQPYGQQPYGQAGFNGTLDPTLVSLIGAEKQSYYVPKFLELKQQNKQISWNWCAFLFGGAWMCYRKMYVFGLAYMVVSMLASLLGDLGSLLTIGMWVCSGLFGNWLYMLYMEKVIEKINQNPATRETELAKRRGASWLTGIGIPVAVGVLMAILGVV